MEVVIMNPRKEMIIIDNEISTSKISYCKYDSNAYKYYIKYKNNATIYKYQTSRVKYITYSEKIDLTKYSFFINQVKLKCIKEAYEFTYNNYYYYHIIFDNNKLGEYTSNQIRKINNNKDVI